MLTFIVSKQSPKVLVVVHYLVEQIEEQERRSEEIEEYRKYTQTKQYVEDLAKERLGLVYKDEIILEADN